jgi:hypothetical protein
MTPTYDYRIRLGQRDDESGLVVRRFTATGAEARRIFWEVSVKYQGSYWQVLETESNGEWSAVEVV